MTAKLCDKCNNFYEIYETPSKYSAIRFAKRGKLDRYFDLCPDCTADFELWIANKTIIPEKDGE